MSKIKNQKTEILNRYMKKAKQLESGQPLGSKLWPK